MRILILFLGQIPSAWANAEVHESSEGIPSSLLYAAINFFLLVGILVYFLRKPVKDFFFSRATSIRTTISQSQELKLNAEKKYAEYEQRLKNIEAEMQSLIAELKQDGELERQRIVQLAQRQVSLLKTTSERVISQELRKAKEEIKEEAAILATELAEKLIRKNMTPQDQYQMVEQYLELISKNK